MLKPTAELRSFLLPPYRRKIKFTLKINKLIFIITTVQFPLNGIVGKSYPKANNGTLGIMLGPCPRSHRVGFHACYVCNTYSESDGHD